MAEFTPRDLVACIRYEFQRDTPFCEALKNFCQVFGNDPITFGKFEFWWYRFKEGNFDLDYKGPPKPELSDIPLDIVEEIIGKMEWKDRCLFRKVSKKCRQVVDSVKYTFNNVDFYNVSNGINLNIDSIQLLYRNHGARDSAIETKSDDRDRAFIDLNEILKNPKNQLHVLSIGINFVKTRDKLHRLIHSLPHQIHVETLQFRGANNNRKSSVKEELLNIIPYLKPGILTDIIFSGRAKVMSTDEFAELDQWKQAKSLLTSVCLSKDFEHIKHFNQLNIGFNDISAEDVIQLKNIFSNSPNFQSAIIRYSGTEKNVMEKLKAKGFIFDDKKIDFKQCLLRYEFSKKGFSC